LVSGQSYKIPETNFCIGGQDMCLAKDHLEAINNVMSNLERDYELLKSKQSELDAKLSTMYHEVEVLKFSGVGGYKKLRQLQILLRERRVVKHELAQMQQVMHHITPKSIIEKIHKTSGNVGKSDAGNQAYRIGWNIKIEDILKADY
jgi:predicted  nucleic acid-binding Zn-ribbon protein